MTMPANHHRLLLIAAIMFVAAGVIVAAAIVVPPMVRQYDDDRVVIDSPVSGPSSSAEQWPVFITTMTHLEGGWTQAATDEGFYTKQADLVRHGMDIAEAYDATLTIESEMPMAEGMATFDDNLLQEVLDRGHGVGTHCDIDPQQKFTDVQMVHEFSLRKDAVDALVGRNENLGCSGGGTFGDWFIGAHAAGFSYLDGVVGYHYLALPESERPDGWDDRAIAKEFYHLPAPQDWDDYFHPFFVNQVGFREDEDGELLITEGSLGRVENLAEVSPWTLTSQADCRGGVCAFDEDDVQAAVAFLSNFVATNDASRPSKITFYLATDAFDAKNDETMAAFFAAIQQLVTDGKVQWASQREVYDVMREYQDAI